MARLIDADESVGIGYLSDWYQNSVDDTKPPIWTDEHIEELINDFIVIPKGTPSVDAVEVVRCRECKSRPKGEYRMCHKLCRQTHEDDFCSYGERRGTDEH